MSSTRKNTVTYLDANVFAFASALSEISAAETTYSQRILAKVANGKLPASTSVLTWDEVVWVCRRELPFAEALSKGNSVLVFPNLKISDVTLTVIRSAAELATTYNLKPRDAIHAATAILHGEKEIITDDADFDKIRELRRVSLAQASR